jgi:glucoamylase
VVTLYYTNRQNESTAFSSLTFGYSSSIANTSWELWTTSTPVYVDGITQLLNLTFVASDIGQTYVQQLNLPVNASGAPEPTLPSPPAPYASPSGFSDDITSFLSVINGSESETAFTRMFLNINPAFEGAVNGTVVAARSGPSYPQTDPDYEYNWVRDASLTMDAVQTLYAAATDSNAKSQYETILFEYSTARATEQNDPGLQTGLGEPKFYLNNTIFLGPWGRPQNDGAATAAITLMEFADDYLSNNGSIDDVKTRIYDSTNHPNTAPVQKDLLFVAANWSSPSFDLWEEVKSDHFYTRMVQRRALVMGSAFATKMGDSSTASTLSSAADALSSTISQFWDPNRGILLYEYGPVLNNKASYLDIAVILGIIHGYAGDSFYSFTNDEVLSSAVRIATAFIDVYPIANTTKDSSGNTLGIPVGRYPGKFTYPRSSRCLS